MPPSSDDLSKYVVKTDVSADKIQSAVGALAALDGGSGGDGAVFAPMEAMAAGMRAGNAFAQMFKIAILVIARAIIAPVELLWRCEFGERYFNGVIVLVFLACYAIARWFMDIGAGYCNVVLGEFILLVCVNRWNCYTRDRDGHYWHSYSEGISWFRIQSLDEYLARHNFTFDATKLFLEPIVTFLAGVFGLLFPTQRIYVVIGHLILNPLAVYLLLAGVVLFFYQLNCYLYRRQILLDEKDDKVIAEVRGLLNTSSPKPGVSIYKGVSYTVLGGKNEWKE